MKPAALLRYGTLLGVLVAVEAACRFGLIRPLTLIAPSKMVLGLIDLLRSGDVSDEIADTLIAIVSAGLSAVIVGFLAGVVIHALPRLRVNLDPLFSTYYTIPIYVFYPMMIVFFGMNRTPIIVIGFLFAVVAMITGTLNGLDRVPKVLLKTARVLQLSRSETVLSIVLPAALPFIFSGVKLAIAYTFVGVLGSEFILSNTGIGYRIALSFNRFDNITMYSLTLFVVCVVVLVNGVLFSWEQHLRRRVGNA